MIYPSRIPKFNNDSQQIAPNFRQESKHRGRMGASPGGLAQRAASVQNSFGKLSLFSGVGHINNVGLVSRQSFTRKRGQDRQALAWPAAASPEVLPDAYLFADAGNRGRQQGQRPNQREREQKMYCANVRLLCAYASAVMAGLCLSGCMAYPQHGQSIGPKDEPFPCAGATVHAGERIAIQALSDCGWITIAETTTSNDPLEWDSGTWYPWYIDEVTVPSECWEYTRSWVYMAADIRAISLDEDVWGGSALFTFEEGFSPGEYSDAYSAWEDYGHGRSITIYGY